MALSGEQQTPAAKAAAIAVPIVFMLSLAIALVIFFWMIRRQRRREEDMERSESRYKDVASPAMQQRKEEFLSQVGKPEQTHQPDIPHTPLVKKSSQPKTPAFLHTPSSGRRTSSIREGLAKLVMPGRMNSEPFARDQGPLVKDAIRDSGLISPGTVTMADYFPARAHADNMSIPSEHSEEEDEDADLEKSGAFSRVSYVDSEEHDRDTVEYGAGHPTTVSHIDRPSVISTRNLSATGHGNVHYYNHYQPQHGAKNMRTL